MAFILKIKFIIVLSSIHYICGAFCIDGCLDLQHSNKSNKVSLNIERKRQMEQMNEKEKEEKKTRTQITNARST